MTSDFDPEEFFLDDRLDNYRNLSEQVDAYPPESNRDYVLSDFREEFDNLPDYVTLAGRIDGIRDHPNVIFVDLVDESIRTSEEYEGAQMIFVPGELNNEDSYNWLDFLNRGDIIQVSGEPGVSNTGEESLVANEYKPLSKSLLEPPQEDLSSENRVRDRVAAIQQDDSLLNNLKTKNDIVRSTREYLWDQGFEEVQTPTLRSIYGGAEATPFETHAEALDEDRYLRIALEIPQKKLMAADMEKIFEIGKVFRNEDIDTTHNPEFTMVEVYEAFSDREEMMRITEDLVSGIAEDIHGTTKVTYDDSTIDFSTPWRRMTVEETINRYGSLDTPIEEMADHEIEELARSQGIEFPGGFNRGEGIMELYDEMAEGQIQNPTFVIDHPQETSPLCKEHREKEGKAERFEAVVAGNELANSYTERNNPVVQGEHFAQQASRFEAGDEEAHRFDEDFVKALGRGMPPAGGLGIGIDRLTMLMTDSQSIKDVLYFPMVSRNT
ncbi:MAG: lysine--tRNA ligase [Candidatus Nanohaloarchaea archaeon]